MLRVTRVRGVVLHEVAGAGDRDVDVAVRQGEEQASHVSGPSRICSQPGYYRL
jgi:hypothetical protein